MRSRQTGLSHYKFRVPFWFAKVSTPPPTIPMHSKYPFQIEERSDEGGCWDTIILEAPSNDLWVTHILLVYGAKGEWTAVNKEAPLKTSNHCCGVWSSWQATEVMNCAGNNVVNGVSSGFGLTLGSDMANSLWHKIWENSHYLLQPREGVFHRWRYHFLSIVYVCLTDEGPIARVELACIDAHEPYNRLNET